MHPPEDNNDQPNQVDRTMLGQLLPKSEKSKSAGSPSGENVGGGPEDEGDGQSEAGDDQLGNGVG